MVERTMKKRHVGRHKGCVCLPWSAASKASSYPSEDHHLSNAASDWLTTDLTRVLMTYYSLEIQSWACLEVYLAKCSQSNEADHQNNPSPTRHLNIKKSSPGFTKRLCLCHNTSVFGPFLWVFIVVVVSTLFKSLGSMSSLRIKANC